MTADALYASPDFLTSSKRAYLALRLFLACPLNLESSALWPSMHTAIRSQHRLHPHGHWLLVSLFKAHWILPLAFHPCRMLQDMRTRATVQSGCHGDPYPAAAPGIVPHSAPHNP